MRKSLLICLMLLTAALIRAETLTGTVRWIMDGDTFDLRNGDKSTTIRLWGIDAPEKDQPGHKRALDAMIDLVARKLVRVEVIDRDKYGRVVGRVYYRKIYVNEEMLRRGCVWWYKRYAPEAKDLEKAFKFAVENRIGMWAYDDNVEPEKWRIAHKEKVSASTRQSQEDNNPQQ